ncbi:hypothetical protein ABIA31_006703 [Catenulispora sp. MAP5-51]|uniref:hypothetical protein n=1 Tax=Catenulispora sp. MAP5-51 TaxID=3156298 RepID=UPI0035143F45
MRLRRERGAGWRIAVGDRQTMTMALWLRDASGMRPDLDPAIPPLDPPVEVDKRLAALAGPRATAQWTGLWLGLWEGRLEDWFTLQTLGPPGFELLVRSPELKKLVEAGFLEAARWSAEFRLMASRGSGAPTSVAREPAAVVRQLENELGRQAQEFELDITVLPVAGRVFWPLADGGLVVSGNLLRDASAFRALLYDVLAAMV